MGLGAPAYAHSGNAAVVLVRNLTLTPVGTGWEAHLTLADLDSGSPIALKLLAALNLGLVEALRNADRRRMRLEMERESGGQEETGEFAVV